MLVTPEADASPSARTPPPTVLTVGEGAWLALRCVMVIWARAAAKEKYTVGWIRRPDVRKLLLQWTPAGNAPDIEAVVSEPLELALTGERVASGLAGNQPWMRAALITGRHTGAVPTRGSVTCIQLTA